MSRDPANMTTLQSPDQSPMVGAPAELAWPHSRSALRAIIECSVVLVLIDLALVIAWNDELPIDRVSWARFISACLILAFGGVALQRVALGAQGDRARRVWWTMGRGLLVFAVFRLPMYATDSDLWREVGIAFVVCYPLGAVVLWGSGEAIPRRRTQRSAATA